MLRTTLALAFLTLFAATVVAASPDDKKKRGGDKDGKDDVVGTIWHYEATSGDKKESGQFRCFNLEFFHGDKKVGSSKAVAADQITVTFTGIPEINGSAPMRKVRHGPAVWKGTLTKADGSKWELTLTVKDK